MCLAFSINAAWASKAGCDQIRPTDGLSSPPSAPLPPTPTTTLSKSKTTGSDRADDTQAQTKSCTRTVQPVLMGETAEFTASPRDDLHATVAADPMAVRARHEDIWGVAAERHDGLRALQGLREACPQERNGRACRSVRPLSCHSCGHAERPVRCVFRSLCEVQARSEEGCEGEGG